MPSTIRCEPPTRCPPAGRCCGWPGCCTTWARPRPWRTATSSATRWRAPGWPRPLRRLRLPRAEQRLARAPGAAAHVRLHARLDRCRRAALHPPRGGGPAGRPVRAARCRQRGQRRGAPGPARPGWTSCAPQRGGRGQRCRCSQAQLAVDGRDLQASSASLPGRWSGSCCDRLLEAVLDDPALNQRDRLLDAGRVDGRGRCPRAPARISEGPARHGEAADDGPAATIGDPGAVPT